MTEEMIEWYNALVADQDRVYILGDVAFTPSAMRRAVTRMKGRKVLIPGNHEPTKMRKYFDLFDDVRGYVQRKGFIMSHIPIHPDCMGRWKLNIHGHLHGNVVMKKEVVFTEAHPESGELLEIQDLRYYNACVEHHNFRPKELDEILWETGLK